MKKKHNATECFTFKLTTKCTNRCRYCWSRSDDELLMSEELLNTALQRIVEYCATYGNRAPRIELFGGEPLLFPLEVLDRACRRFEHSCEQAGIVPQYGITTNAILLDEKWGSWLVAKNASVRVSIDGDESIHDKNRVFADGRGTYAVVRKNVALFRLRYPKARLAAYATGASSVCASRLLTGVVIDNGIRTLEVFFPQVLHDQWQHSNSESSLGSFFIQLFKQWLGGYVGSDVRIGIGERIIRGLCTGDQQLFFDGSEISSVTINADGSVDACSSFLFKTELDISTMGFAELDTSGFLEECVQKMSKRHDECYLCRWASICGGGPVRSRYSELNGFRNKSAFCADIQELLLGCTNVLAQKFNLGLR